MSFYADLHIHSKYSRATSKHCDLEHLAYWARKKGISVIGTGDFTHPVWMSELKDKLVLAEPGLFRLKPEIEKEIKKKLPPTCRGPTRFMLSVEISTIYKKGDKVRKIHHLLYAPDFEKADRIRSALDKIGNLNSDGRPILGLDSRHLLEITLEGGEGCYLVPAHIWTPWFAMFGSKSGFDSVKECYRDLAGHIFALETGLSSDPEMNWRLSQLDGYRLVSNSDAHSPDKLGRESCLFRTEMDYFAMLNALKTGEGFGGTLEFFPEEGKYHLDGHRKCDIRLTPEQTREVAGICPVCGRGLTVGVMHRVAELADRPPEPEAPPGQAGFQSLVPLPEILGEILQKGPRTKTVGGVYENLLSKLGSEFFILEKAPIEEVEKAGTSLIAEAISRLRREEVIREAGFDGEYGKIKMFTEKELKQGSSTGVVIPKEEKQPDIAKKYPVGAPLCGCPGGHAPNGGCGGKR